MVSTRVLVIAASVMLALSTASAGAVTISTGPDGKVDRLGAFNVGYNPKLANAVAKLGEPTERRRDYSESCYVFWSRFGLHIYFVNLGGQNPCHGQYGYAQVLIIKGEKAKKWRTDRGLRFGARVTTIPRFYPTAERHSNGWWLTKFSYPVGGGCPCDLPGLRATGRNGRIAQFAARIQAAGD